jgi:hypothetical protein
MGKNNLISISAFRKQYFKEGSAPGQTTVRRWIQTGAIAGRVVKGSERPAYYVDANAWEHSTGDESVDDFLTSLGDSKAA